MSVASRSHVEDLLRRIDELTQGLDRIKDPSSRQAARELLEAVLDLHGVALARIATALSSDAHGCAIYEALGHDEQVKPVLLLYNLHPDSAEERVRNAIASLRDRLNLTIRLLSVSDGVARVAVSPGGEDWDALCHTIGGTLIDAAPDLDDIAIERHLEPSLESPPEVLAVAAAG